MTSSKRELKKTAATAASATPEVAFAIDNQNAAVNQDASRETSSDALRDGNKTKDAQDDKLSRLKQIQLEDFERTQLHRAKVYARGSQPNTADADLVYYAPSFLEKLGPWMTLRAVVNYTIEIAQTIWPPGRDWLSTTFWLYNVTLVAVAILFTFLQLFFWAASVFLPQSWIEAFVDYNNSLIVDQHMFNNMQPIIDDGQKALGRQGETRTFDPVLAEYLLNMAAAVYIRDGFVFRQAEDYYQKQFFLDGCKISKFRTIKDSTSFTRKKLSTFFRESVAPIVKLTDQLNVSYHLISELETGYGGPYASLMASKAPADPFVVVVFKGTSPLDLDEWLIDLTYRQVDAEGFFRGKIHQGFFTCLFPDREHVCTRSESRLDYYPYETLVEAINLKVNKLAQQTKVDTVPVWVTGHSLGAGVATLFYGWLLNNADKLTDKAVLGDAYTYGTPATGNQEYARGYYDSFLQRPKEMLWRMICDHDIVTRVPLNKDTAFTGGIGEPELQPVREKSYLNYSAPGSGIRIFSDTAPVMRGAFDIKTEEEKPTEPSTTDFGKRLVFLKVLRWVPGMRALIDHTPTRYAECLRFSRGKYQLPAA